MVASSESTSLRMTRRPGLVLEDHVRATARGHFAKMTTQLPSQMTKKKLNPTVYLYIMLAKLNCIHFS